MATRRDETASVKKKAPAAGKAAPRKAAAVKKAGGAAPAKKPVAAATAKKSVGTAPARKPGTPGLLRAGLKALDNVRSDVVKRQANVIESLLGIGQGARSDTAARKFPSLDSFGIRKFEDVFDQRVATAMQRLGMPTAEEMHALREQMRLLLERLDRIESGRRKR